MMAYKWSEELVNILNRVDTLLTDRFGLKVNKRKTKVMKTIEVRYPVRWASEKGEITLKASP